MKTTVLHWLGRAINALSVYFIYRGIYGHMSKSRALSICKLMTHSEGKRCALALSHSAMRVTEIALLQTKSILYPSGKIRKEIYLPASICKGLRPRTIWLTHKLPREIIQDWIDYRIKKRWGTVINGGQYQGLIPESRFLYSNRGRPML